VLQYRQSIASSDEHNQHIERVGHLSSILVKNNITVIASFISPYEESRRFVRDHCQNFIEVYVTTPLEVCEQRDSKGLYDRARKGEIKMLTGVDDPYEIPNDHEITVDTVGTSVEENTKKFWITCSVEN
jgi:adenylylsulfate kinase-like enzyme